jgi:conjugal transfer pilus assembly protein TraE
MKFKDALRNMRELQMMTKGLLVSNVILAIGVLYGLNSLTGQRERIVLVPPMLDQKLEVAWKSANQAYVKSFALYVATLVGNMQPKSSTVVLDSVSAFMDPEIYTDFRRQMMALIEDPVFKSSGSVISFQPSSIQYEAETNRVFVPGSLITSTTGTQKYQKQVTYEMAISIREGRPWVTHFLSYEGTVPRTVQWHVSHSTKNGTEIPAYALPDRYKKKLSSSESANQQLMDLDGMKPTGSPIADTTPVAPASAAVSAASEAVQKEQN